jgi:hypothetical protein
MGLFSKIDAACIRKFDQAVRAERTQVLAGGACASQAGAPARPDCRKRARLAMTTPQIFRGI